MYQDTSLGEPQVDEDEATEYVASKTAVDFHADDSYLRAVRGPVGSGKSSMMVFELLRRAMAQAPNKKKIRKTRGLVVRNTYSELKSTTIKTWMFWLGGLGEVVYDSPIRFHMKMPLEDGTLVDFEVYFLPLDNDSDIKKLKSLEVTFCWINEFSEVPISALKMIKTRVGRYPAKRDGGPSWRGIICDTNPYAVRSDWYELLEVERPRQHRLFIQPGGMLLNPDFDEELPQDDSNKKYLENPDAENIANLDGGYDYYQRIIAGNTDDYIKVYVLGEPGVTYDGKPVYANTYSDQKHVSHTPIQATRNSGGLVLGMDFGLNPAAVITQMSPTGCVLVLDEVVPSDVTFDEFIDEHLVPVLRTRYAGFPIQIIGDPAGQGRNVINKMTVFEMLKARGLAGTPAYTNEFPPRRQAVSYFLTRRNGMLLSPRCVTLREAMSGKYRYKKAAGSGDTFKPLPEKNFESHIAEALQYASLHYWKQVVRPSRQRVKRPEGAAKPFLFA